MKSNLIFLKKLELFKELDNYKDGQFFAVADQKIKNHLPQWIQFSPHVFWLKDPEEEKNLEVFGRALEFFLRQGICRSSVIYAFGGGATTDFAGHVASIILRGVKWVAVPTTLLGMVDGSIGGKVGLNMPQGKNLIGSLHTPEKIYICGDFLTTLSERDWISGKGEILKYGFLSKEINELILRKAPVEEIALECAKYKSRIVNDTDEDDDRVFLELGHTLGYAFESTLKISHGHAVAMGLKYVFKIFLKYDELNSQWEKMAKALMLPIEKLSIEHFSNFNFLAFSSFLEQDKKKIESRLKLILMKGIGSCYVEEISMKDFRSKLAAHAEFKS